MYVCMFVRSCHRIFFDSKRHKPGMGLLRPPLPAAVDSTVSRQPSGRTLLALLHCCTNVRISEEDYKIIERNYFCTPPPGEIISHPPPPPFRIVVTRYLFLILSVSLVNMVTSVRKGAMKAFLLGLNYYGCELGEKNVRGQAGSFFPVSFFNSLLF